MSVTLAASDLAAFRLAVAKRLGLSFDNTKSTLLADVLSGRLASSGLSAAAYLEWLGSDTPLPEEVRALAPVLTVAETYFFRCEEQFRALEARVLPERVSARRADRQVRVLSAGCASGEEPYSLAIVMRDRLPDVSWGASILGVDLNPEVLERARLARYSAWSLRETPQATRVRWFRPDGRDFVLDPAIVNAVQFAQRNLADEDPALWQPGSYDIVFCRNVIMYATPQAARSLIGRITRALAPGGYLFLGHAETLRGLSDEYQQHHSHGAFYYERTGARLTQGGATSTNHDRRRPEARDPAATSFEPGSWVASIDRSRARIESIWNTPATRAESAPLAALPAADAPALDAVRALLEHEHFAEALEALRALPENPEHRAETLLLTAVALSHQGQFAPAERACAELLALDERNAFAPYVLALCREGVGDRAGAMGCDERSIECDPDFAFPRLHLGLLARRAGDRETTRRELAQALLLFPGESASHLQLFGGGFSRESLGALCRAELERYGGMA